METEFEEVKKEVKRYGSEVGEILPHANWITLKGMFTPAQLRIIANEVEEQYKQ